ncbi:MAG TPA: AMP-binding protein, partial [Chloroflexia bacterium]|nr:AMP-binding protein [Chloroflexia bacterium]
MTQSYFAQDSNSPEIAWRPTPAYIERSRLRRFMLHHGIDTFGALVERYGADPAWFWQAVVEDLGLEWYEPYKQVLDLSGGIEWARWFAGGSYNYVRDAVDKHAGGPLSAATAIGWEGEDGEVRNLTYDELSRQVNQAANALRALGVGRGDRVGVYMPMLPETAVAVLAISKIGAIYIPVFSGYGGAAIASRLQDCRAKLLITADGFYRAGKWVRMKEAADEAVAASPTVEHTLVVSRHGEATGSTAPWTQGRDVWWHELVGGQSEECDTVRTGAGEPYMIIYTSGTTGRPKGVVHLH